MKFVCDSCNTKYSIADERVHGRVLKIRCKTCDHVITVREEMKPQEPTPAASSLADLGRNLGDSGDEHTMVSTAPPPPPAEQADEWYVSFDGEQEGPMPLARALERVRLERPRGKEAHAWRPGFFVWLAVEEVPEFAPALERKKKPTPPPMPPSRPSRPMATVGATVKSPSGSQPALRSGTGPQPILKAPEPAPLIPSVASPEPLPPLDSKPVPLPPPPEPLKDAPLNLPLPAIPAPLPAGDSIPSGPMAVQVTKPEPRIARKALEEAKPEPPPPLIPPREAGAPEVSPFAAALAAATGNEVKPPLDTGPVPLPPPPGSDPDLAISEPSGLLSISHLAQSPSPLGPKPVIDTFGGVAVTPPGSNGTVSSAPVVVVAGPAQSAAAWVKWSVAALLVLVIGLGGTVIYLVTRRPVPASPPPVVAESPNKRVEDKPIQVADPAPPTSIGLPTPPEPANAKKGPSAAKHTAPPKPVATGPKLSDDQKKLAALYGETGDKHSPRDTTVSDRSERAAQTQVSQTSIMAVVTQNKRALNLCYDRVLKHDSSLKRARLLTRVKIGLSGNVIAVTIPDPEYSGSEISQCLTQTIKRWHFPSADGEYETEFPIILQAD
jgi:predicted Zn finger-like uncharacterized protein